MDFFLKTSKSMLSIEFPGRGERFIGLPDFCDRSIGITRSHLQRNLQRISSCMNKFSSLISAKGIFERRERPSLNDDFLIIAANFRSIVIRNVPVALLSCPNFTSFFKFPSPPLTIFCINDVRIGKLWKSG